MRASAKRWDYLILTAANAAQAEAYRMQLGLRREAGTLGRFGDVLVIPDREGRRIGSGGSTIECLLELARREAPDAARGSGTAALEAAFGRLRVLIVHAGGDSRRLPAYSACGKIFVPLPARERQALPATLFDRLVSIAVELPPAPEGSGQIVVTSGDALLLFDPSPVDFSRPGITALAAFAEPEEASRHGVFCPNPDGSTRLYLQKPSLEEQRAQGAISPHGRTPLDIGVMSFDGAAAAALLGVFCDPENPAGPGWRQEMLQLVFAHGLDLYREICCAMGTGATREHYLRAARGSGSRWPDSALAGIYPSLHAIPMPAVVLDGCAFLHFGATRQLIASGLTLAAYDAGAPPEGTVLTMTTAIGRGGLIRGADSWVEGCRVRAPLVLGGNNAVTGLDVDEPLELPPGACLDLSPGVDRRGRRVWFVRCYGVNDTFKHPAAEGAEFCGMPLAEWLDAAGAASEVWDEGVPEAARTLWNARVFPAETDPARYRDWLWMFDAARSGPARRRAFLAADRYSAAEIALLVSQEAFHAGRLAIHSAGLACRTAAAEREFV